VRRVRPREDSEEPRSAAHGVERASGGGWPWAARGADAEAGQLAGVARGCARRRGEAAPWLERFAAPLFERILLQKFILKCLK
jgi:hypothetical protein